MSTLKFTEDHEWVSIEGDDIAVVGITDYAQEQLGELVFIELPEVGSDVTQGDETAIIESVKAAGDVKSPVSGSILEVNEALIDTPGLVNDNPETEGWFFKVKASEISELDDLMDEEAYRSFVKDLA
ncbi:MAG: glycine cleavage system protein GcvH [Gammaproteobacteria bacterium]|nr:glycine cleavage system protein GcvH [Gammaproteobacteria bacterium]